MMSNTQNTVLTKTDRNELSKAEKHLLYWTQTGFDFDGMTQPRRLIARLIVVALALAIIFIRMPIVFLHPAFWGEDAPFYFQSSYLYGWKSIATDTTAGYLTLFQWLVGNTSTYFPVSVAPTIFNAASIALTLVIVWLVTSPRLSLPAKPLLALAVVTVPAAYEELATLANSQWIFPIGAFSILLMAPSKNKFVSAAEIAFVSIFSLTGPFSLLLLPVCGLQMVRNREDADAQRRTVILSAIIGIGATIECIYILRNFAGALTFDLEPIRSSWQLWVVLPIARITAPIGHAVLRTLGEVASLPIAVIAYCTIAYFALRAPYRAEKIAMLMFAFAIIATGMLKARSVLPLTGLRYFYLAQVFSVWFFCCVPQTSRAREIFTGLVATALLIMVLAGANRPRAAENSEWPAWSREIRSGLPVKIPTAPPGWFVTLPADPHGPLARFAAWQGKNFSQLGLARDDTSCAGAIDTIESRLEMGRGPPLSIVRGWAKPSAGRGEVVAVALINSEKQVVGFGIPGFISAAGQTSGWAGVVEYPKTDISAFAIVSQHEDTVCRLARN